MPQPVVFVHGNGDSAALWHTTLWRFESNAYSHDRLFAIDFRFPQARDDDALPMECRSGSDDQLRELAAFVAHVLATTGAPRIAMIASSRGANAVRNFIRFGNGEPAVSHAVLCGGVNHGVFASPTYRPRSEFNGAGPFMRGLNAPYPDGNELSPRVRWLTLRSDCCDKYAQPVADSIGEPGMPTHVDYDAPALRGAVDVVLPGADHREVAFGPQAFAHMYRFVTGAAPATLDIAPEPRVVLNGIVSGYCAASPTNCPLDGARVSVFEVAPQTGMRLGTAPYCRTIGRDGNWGTFVTHPAACLEFVIEADGYPVTHVYRSPFPRGSSLVHLRPAPPGSLPSSDREDVGWVTITRPRGYFGVGRDVFEIDGEVPAGVTSGVPAISAASLRIEGARQRTVMTRFNAESIAVVNRPGAGNRVVIAEFHG